MSRKVETATTGAEFIQIARKSPRLQSERWAGSHWQGTTEAGRVTIANHNKELPPFLRVKIRRENAGDFAGVIVFLYFSNLV